MMTRQESNHIISLIKTGDIALYRSSNPYGLLIRAIAGPYTHAEFLSREASHRVDAFGMNDGWSFHDSFERYEFIPQEQPDLVRIIRPRYVILFEPDYINENIRLARSRARALDGIVTPYDWPMVLNEAARFILKPFRIDLTKRRPLWNPQNRFMCSEIVSAGIWNPAWLKGYRGASPSIFTDHWPEWDTPTEIAKGGVTIWQRGKH
jgi:hypothetical protein